MNNILDNEQIMIIIYCTYEITQTNQPYITVIPDYKR